MASRKGSHSVFAGPFLHFLTLQTAVAAKRMFPFKDDREFKCVSHLSLHLGHRSFPRQPPLSKKSLFVPKKFFFFLIFFVLPKAFEPLKLET